MQDWMFRLGYYISVISRGGTGCRKGDSMIPQFLAYQLTLLRPGVADNAHHTTSARVSKVVADHDSLLTQ